MRCITRLPAPDFLLAAACLGLGLAVLGGSALAQPAANRTFEARYVLDGDAAAAPLGATVTIGISATGAGADMEVPLGAILDDGSRTGVWRLDESGSQVAFQPVRLVRVTGETAIVSGLEAGRPIVSLGVHLLRDGQPVKPSSTIKAASR